MDFAKLREHIKGTVITPSDGGYDEARKLFYGGMDKKPAVIVQAKDVSDVVEAIALARQTGLELAVRSGGHSLGGFSVSDGGIMLDLRHLRSLKVNQKDKTAWVEPGLTAGEYSKALDKYDLATGFGDTGSVGIGGITLGGGIGFLVRKFGLAIDNLLAAEMVTADGERLRVDAEHHPDLFWAIRGGGGNFGVATRFKFKLRELSEAYGGFLILPAEADVLVRFMHEAEKAPEELSVIANVMPAMPMPFLPKELHGKMILMAIMMYVGDAKSAEKVLAPFRALTKPLADMLKSMRYHEIFMPEDESYHPMAINHVMFMKSIDHQTAQTIIDRLAASDASVRVVQLRPLGGAMARVPKGATAFAHRSSPIMANIAAFYDGPKDHKIREAWVAEFANILDQGEKGAYIGFIADEGEQRVHDAYPTATWRRLAAVKAHYDPTNLFKLNHNIVPTKSK